MDYVDEKKPSKEIELSELKRAIDMIFNHIQNDLKTTKIRLDHDYYASLDVKEKFEVMSVKDDRKFLKNFDIGLGQLYDDWDFLESMMQDNSAVTFMFEHVAPLLRYIAYKTVKEAETD